MIYNIDELQKNLDAKDSKFSSYKKVVLDVYSENQQVEDMFDDMCQCIDK